MIHVDTSFLVDLIRERRRAEQGPATIQLVRHRDEELRISVHVACELYAGAELSQRPRQERETIQSLISAFEFSWPDDRFAPKYASLLALLERRGERAGVMDLLVATAAIIDEAALVSRDTRGFERIPELKLITY